jgi:hypothetical protein
MIESADIEEMQTFLKTRGIRDTIGKALGKAYPTVKWLVSVSGDGTVAQIVAPDLTSEYGMTIHTDQIGIDLEAKAVRFGGELLERFNVSRMTGDTSSVVRNVRGDSIHGKAGGV